MAIRGIQKSILFSYIYIYQQHQNKGNLKKDTRTIQIIPVPNEENNKTLLRNIIKDLSKHRERCQILV